LFLHGKVFNTNVDKFVEIKAAPWRNFRQFNILPRIALFVCNIGLFCSTAARVRAPDRHTIIQIGFPCKKARDTCDQDNQIGQEVRRVPRLASSVRENSLATRSKKSKNP
jgi:hypothetical protein